MKLQKEELLVEVDELKKLMDLLSNLFAIRTSFMYAIGNDQYESEIAGNNGDYQPFCQIIQQEMHDKCIACDREQFKLAVEKKTPWIYQCYNGLYEMFLPLFIEENLVGYLHFGQVRSEDDFETIAKKYELNKHSKLEKLKKSYENMEVIPREKLILISELFQRMADNILKNKLVEIRTSKPEHYLRKYIEENYAKDISLSKAAKHINRSSSFVTHMFKKKFGSSFHQYLTKVRIEEAKEKLKNHSILETSQLCGFKNRYHFSRIFKSEAGITPFEFKRLKN